MAGGTVGNQMGDSRTTIDYPVASLSDSIVGHTITLMMLIFVMVLSNEEFRDVAALGNDDRVL